MRSSADNSLGVHAQFLRLPFMPLPGLIPLVCGLLAVAGPLAVAAPGSPDTGLPVGAPVVLGGTHTKVTVAWDGRVYFSGKTGSSWQVSRLKSPFPMSDERRNVSFEVDGSFHRAAFSGSPPEGGGVNALAVQADGGVVVGGDFQQVDGTDFPNLARLASDGTLEATFPARFNGPVNAVVVQPDGKILVGGSFTRVTIVLGIGGSLITTTPYDCPGFARLMPDGTMDEAFHSVDRFSPGHPSGVVVNTIALERSGHILVGGRFVAVRWMGEFQTRDGYARLRPDGSFDSTFPNVDLDPPAGYTRPDVRVIAIQPDGKVLVAGRFREAEGHHNTNIVRLRQDGTTDPGFVAGTSYGYGPIHIEALWPREDGRFLVGYSVDPGLDSHALVLAGPDGLAERVFEPSPLAGNRIDALAGLSDGSVLAAGRLRTDGFSEDRWLVRVFPDFSVDAGSGFPALPLNIRALGLAVRPEGGFVVGGADAALGGSNPGYLGAFLANGQPDPAFTGVPPLSGPVHCVATLRDGSVVFGGEFSTSAGAVTRYLLARGIPPPTGSGASFALDPAFGQGVGGYFVHSLATDQIFRFLVAGRFTVTGSGGAVRTNLARLDANGILDPSFEADLVFSSGPSDLPAVWDVDIDSQDRIVIAGNFTSVDGVVRPGLARLLPDGSLDASFVPGVPSFARIGGVTLLGDGRMLVFGAFVGADGIARLGEDGSVDAGFSPTWPLARGADTSLLGVENLAAQADGTTVVSRRFMRGNYQAGLPNDYWNEITHLPPAGPATWLNYLDSPFTSASGGPLFYHAVHASTTLQRNGQILLAGEFTKTDDGVHRGPVARLFNNPAEDWLHVEGAGAIVWNRWGSAPEAETVYFDYSADGGQTWMIGGFLGRAPGSWEWWGSLPSSGLVRVRARIPSGGTWHGLSSPGQGGAGGSRGLVEAYSTYRTPLVFLFRNWMLDYFPNHPVLPSYIAFSLDSDLDGLSDLAEFALGTRPDQGLSGSAPLRFAGSFSGGGSLLGAGSPVLHETGDGEGGTDRRMLYLRRKDRHEIGLTYEPQFSTDLAAWAESSDPGTVVAADAVHEVVAVRFPVVFEGASRVFFRLRLQAEGDAGFQ